MGVYTYIDVYNMCESVCLVWVSVCVWMWEYVNVWVRMCVCECVSVKLWV